MDNRVGVSKPGAGRYGSPSPLGGKNVLRGVKPELKERPSRMQF